LLTRAKKYDDCALASISFCLLGLITLPVGDVYVSSFSAGKNLGDKPNRSFAGTPYESIVYSCSSSESDSSSVLCMRLMQCVWHKHCCLRCSVRYYARVQACASNEQPATSTLRHRERERSIALSLPDQHTVQQQQ
jgi:hypothetical protein